MAKLTVTDIPHMLKMWDQELNIESPEKISVNCLEPKYWKCPDCGYSWSVAPKIRYKGSGKCPCHDSNKVICKGVNDALTIVKGLDKFLDENNNFDEIYTQGKDSSLPVNFKCDECGRTWTATLRSQAKKDCNGGYIAFGCPHYNTLKRKYEDIPFCSEVDSIFKFWDDKNPLDPTKTKSNSNEKAHFICKNCGYDWTCEIRSQTRGTGKCMCCELQLVTRKDINDVFTLIPESKNFFDFSKNKDIDIYSIPLRNTDILIDWKCPDCNRQWRSPLCRRVKGKKGNYSFAGCRECFLHSKERIIPVSSIPKLMKYWDFKKNKGIDPNLTGTSTNISVNWRCKECGYEWITTIRGRFNSSGDCPFCSGWHRSIATGVNDVLTLCPDFAKIYDFEQNGKNGIDIYKENVTSRTVAHFKCPKCGNEWDSAIFQRIKKLDDGTYKLIDCSACSNELFRKTPYSVEFPILAKMYREDLNDIPLDSIRGDKGISNTYYNWDCPNCGKTFQSTLKAMRGSHKTATKGCPYCSRTKLLDEGSFARLHPDLMDEYDPDNTIDPYNVFPNDKNSVGWICRDCDYHWSATFALRHAGGGICPVCNRTTLIPEINSFAAVYPDYVKYWADSNKRKADEVFYNSSEYFRFICPTCKGEYSPRVREVVNDTDKCPYCKGIKILPGYNSFADKHPDLLNEMDKIANHLLLKTPYEVSDKSNYKFWFICKKNPNHKYFMPPRTRLMFEKREKEPCLFCRGYRRKLNHFTLHNKNRSH